jgi:hypothetical protein
LQSIVRQPGARVCPIAKTVSFASATRGLCALSVALLLAAPVEAAKPRSFALNVVREVDAEGCIGSPQLAGLLEQWIGPVFVVAGEAELSIETLLWRDPDRSWRARVTVSDAAGASIGRRELRFVGETCRGIDRQLALVIALVIDPEFARRGLPDEFLQTFPGGTDPGSDLLQDLRQQRAQQRGANRDAPPFQARTPAATSAAAEIATEDSRQEARESSDTSRSGDSEVSAEDWAWSFGAGLHSGVGHLPRVAAGAGLSFGAEPPGFWPLLLSMGLWFENDASLLRPTSRGDAVQFSALQIGASLCPGLFETPTTRLSACFGLLVVRRATDSAALGSGRDVSRVALGPNLGVDFALKLRDLVWLTVGLSSHAPLARDAFTYLDQLGTKRTLFRPAFASLAGQLGVSLRL